MSTISSSISGTLERSLRAESVRSVLARFNWILTSRGAAFCIFLAYLLLGPARNETDIIAGITAFSLLAILVLSALVTVLTGGALRKNLYLVLSSPMGSSVKNYGELVSGKPFLFSLRVSGVKLLPLFVLSIRVEFEHDEIQLSYHRILGEIRDGTLLLEDVNFPHRGEWRVKRVLCSLGDQLGFTTLRWEIDGRYVSGSFLVSPPKVSSLNLPVLSSSNRSGDSLVHTRDRQGDLFDLKPYHPSDGMRRIIWKVYAKTGNLISRHPEPAMSPEGKVLVYVAASKKDDHVCSAALAYTDLLEDHDLEIIANCEGATGGTRAVDRDSLEKLLIESVWNTSHRSPNLLETSRDLLTTAQLELPDIRFERVIIFGSADRFSSSKVVDEFESLGVSISTQGISPVFFLISSRIVEKKSVKDPRKPKLLNWFFEQTSSTQKETPSELNSFLAVASRRGWEVVTREVAQ